MRLGNYACEAQVAGVLEYERQPALRVETWPPPGLCSELSERVPEQLSPAGLEEPNKARQALRSTRQRSKNLLWGKHAKIEVATTLNTMLPAP